MLEVFPVSRHASMWTPDSNKITALFMVAATLSCRPADDAWVQYITAVKGFLM